MFYKVWNGLTKYLKSVVISNRKPCEIQGFAIFLPVLNKQHRRSATVVSGPYSSGASDHHRQSLKPN